MTHQAEQGAFPYRYAGSEAFEMIAQPTPRLPVPTSVPPQSPIYPSSWHIPSETEPILNVSTAGTNLERPAYAGAAYEFTRNDDHRYHYELSAPLRRYDLSALEHHLDLPLPQSHYISGPSGTLHQFFPRIRAYEVLYTDDARMKLGDGIRRQCFNCRAVETTTWRRSMLSQGKLLCNRCGLFERTHGVPRPKTFPRRRRSQPPSAHPSVDPATFDRVGYCHYDGRPSVTSSLTAHSLDAFGPMGMEATPRDMSGMAHNMASASTTPSNVSPHHTATQQPMTYGTDYPSTMPAELASIPSSNW